MASGDWEIAVNVKVKKGSNTVVVTDRKIFTDVSQANAKNQAVGYFASKHNANPKTDVSIVTVNTIRDPNQTGPLPKKSHPTSMKG